MGYTSFRKFSKVFWWLYVILVMILLLSVTIFCVVFRNVLYDVSAWASMIAGIATYIGSAFLGIVVFYNSWVQVKIQEKNDEMVFDLMPGATFENGFFLPFLEEEIEKKKYIHSFKACSKTTAELNNLEFHYLLLTITNLTSAMPSHIKVEGLYFVNPQNCVEKVKQYSVISDFSFDSMLDYKQTATVYIGAPSKMFARDYYTRHKYFNCFVVFKASNPKGQVQYHIMDYVLGETLGISKKVLSEKQYLHRCEKYGVPVVLTQYNKQFFHKVTNDCKEDK